MAPQSRDKKDQAVGGSRRGRGPKPVSTRRHKAKPVIYKSTALNNTAPNLVAAADPVSMTNSGAIQQANDQAERVRDQFKLEKCGPEIDVGEGDDEATNAKKYERRLLMNRHSAAASRVRREAYTKALEASLVQHEAMLKQVNALLELEKEKNTRLCAVAGLESQAEDDEKVEDEEDMEDSQEQSDVEDMGLEEASAAGLVHEDAGFPMESQTEEVGPVGMQMSTDAGVSNVGVQDGALQTGITENLIPNFDFLDQIPQQHQALFAPLKTEEMLLANALPLLPPNQKLLDCFMAEITEAPEEHTASASRDAGASFQNKLDFV